MFQSLSFKTILLIPSLLFLIGCSAMGTSPSDEKKSKYADSKQFNVETGLFDNRIPNLIDKMWDRNFTFKAFVDYFSTIKDIEPAKKLPEMKPNVAEFLKPSDDLKIIWFGHSSFLLNLDGTIVLVDPVFSGAAAPVSFMVKRFQEPVLKLTELPKVDFVLISHDHYDHLDMESIEYFKDKKTKFITPLAVGNHLEGWGIPADRIIEKDWWESVEFEGVEFTCTPAQHFSGRGLFDRNETLWSSWVLKSKNHKIYFSGDSGYDIHFKEIGEKLGPFDIAFLETGQYNKKWEEVHMLPHQAVKAYYDLGAKKFFPVHWGMFVLAQHAWNDPVLQLIKLTKDTDVNLVVPKIGQMIYLNQKFQLESWWDLKDVVYNYVPNRSYVIALN
jgi:L-ascorbate metabolism protein UlaG (beta-lactamase superfamily)